MRIALVVATIAVIAGAFFYGLHVGKQGQKVIYQEKIIKTGERHADIEKKQSEIISNRSSYNIIERLQSWSF